MINPRDGYGYFVSRNKVYRVDSVFGETLLGTINTLEGPISMAHNGSQVMFVDGTDGWIITMSSGALAEISDGEFTTAPKTVIFIDGYFAVNVGGTGQWQISSLNDGTAWDATDVTTAESSPDDLRALFEDHGEVCAMGDTSIDVYRNTGNADFPFERVQALEAGLAAAFSVAKIDNRLMWLGRDEHGEGMVWVANGYNPQRVSTHAIERAIASYGVIEDAIAFTYQQEGHSFYQLTFPTGNATWVYDVASSAALGYPVWHERAYRNPGTASNERHRANCHMHFFGRHVIGDYQNGKLYSLNLDAYDDAGNPRRWVRVWRALSERDQDPLKTLCIHKLQLDGEVGIGLATGQGSDPQVMLRVSEDGGHTWSSEIWAGLGAAGEYGTRVLFEQLGEGQDLVFELSGSDPVPVAWTGAYMEASYSR